MDMRSVDARWSKTGIYVVSIVLACALASFLLPPDDRVSGGAVAFAILIIALILRFLIWLCVDQVKMRRVAKEKNEKTIV